MDIMQIIKEPVVVAVATVPASPLAVTTDTDVTVPVLAALSVRSRPVDESIRKGSVTAPLVFETPSAAGMWF